MNQEISLRRFLCCPWEFGSGQKRNVWGTSKSEENIVNARNLLRLRIKPAC